jgi:hypothetical protein
VTNVINILINSRERNRIHARNTRERKRIQMEALQQKIQELTDEVLLIFSLELKKFFSVLKQNNSYFC